MGDNLGNRGAQDRQRIDVNQEHECRYWSGKFGVSTERLRQTVKQVGPLVEDVRKQLGK